MKRIIDGKVYDTKTAEEIATWSNGYPCNDFKHCEETLYRTKKGSWFVAGEGGAMSKYAVQYGNSYGGGSGLYPFTEDEARQWLEDKDFVEALEKHFADKLEEA